MNFRTALLRSSLWLAILVTISIIYLSLARLSPQPMISFNHLDKIQHSIAYLVLSFFWFVTFKEKNKMIWVFAACIGLGVLLEILQAQTGYRVYEYGDMLANTFGVLLGYCIFRWIFKN